MDPGAGDDEDGDAPWFTDLERKRIVVDPLTGVYSAHPVLRQLDESLGRAASAGLSISLAFCDLDWFKQVNDEHGYRVGDDVLAGIAASFVRDARPDDIVTRYSGDEFLTVLFDADLRVATAWAETALAGLADLQNPALVRAMTASFGVATHDGRESCSQLLERADHAMYRAKSAGGNRVEVDDPRT